MFALLLLQSFVADLSDRISHDQEGATAVEYGLMVALIAVVIITAVALVGTNLTNVFNAIAARLTAVN